MYVYMFIYILFSVSICLLLFIISSLKYIFFRWYKWWDINLSVHKSKAHLRNYTKKDFAKSLDNTGVTYVKETLILSIKARDIFWASLNIWSQIISHTPFHDTTFFYICVCIWTYSWGDFQTALGRERRPTLNVSGGLLWPGLLEYIMQSIRKPPLSLLRLLTGASSVSTQPPLADASSTSMNSPQGHETR